MIAETQPDWLQTIKELAPILLSFLIPYFGYLLNKQRQEFEAIKKAVEPLPLMQQALDDVKKVVEPIPGIVVSLDGKLKAFTDSEQARALAEGQEIGRAKLLAEQALVAQGVVAAQSAQPPPHIVDQNGQSLAPTVTAAATPDAAPLTTGVAKELLDNQTVVADKGEGWTQETEPPQN